MGIRRDNARGILTDAVDDRRQFLEAIAGDAKEERETRREIEAFQAMLARYRDEPRVVLDEDDRHVMRRACRCALYWREGFVESIANTDDKAHKLAARIEVRQARAMLEALGGTYEDPALANGRSLTLAEIMASDIGTKTVVERNGDVETRRISENGKPLGVIETDADGVVRVTLADGKIVNIPFGTAADAQEWLLRRYSNNLLFSIHRLQGGDEMDGPSP